MYSIVDYGWMRRDTAALDAWRRALAAVVTPHSVVVDAGAGVGTYGLLALQLGAARVYAIEPAAVWRVAEEIARVNGFEGRITFVRARIEEAVLPERADILVSDLSGALPLFREHIPSLIHARDAFLKREGTMIPAADRLLCAPVSSEALYARVVSGWRSLAGLDFGPAERMALNAAHALPVEPGDLAAEPQTWGVLDYATIRTADVRATLTWDVPATVHGFALWFERTLAPGITITSGPANPASIHATLFLPIAEPIPAAGELALTLDARLVDGRYVVTWQLAGREPQSTFFAELIDP
jgi:protein arginine N-methyltransferase 1